MEIYLSKLILNPQSRRVWDDLGNLQNMHRTVSKAFPAIEADAAAPRREQRTPRSEYNLLHRVDFDQRGGKAVLLVQSKVQPDWSFLREGYAAEIECKTVHEQYAAVENGMRLLFRLRANPTKRVGKSDTKAAERFHESKIRRRVELIGDERETVEEKQIRWLARKGENAGFRLTGVRIKDNVENAVAAAQGKINFKKKRSDDRKITFGSVIFEGVLEVTDAEKFRAALQIGIGTGKAYGFGLLSIARIQNV